MLGHHPSIVIPQNSEYAKEMRRHEAQFTQHGPPGRPYVYQDFPKMFYKAVRAVKGGITFDQFTVQNDDEVRNMQSRGFSVTQALAIEALEREQAEHGALAAERNFEIQHGRISERAAAEVRVAEAEHGARHLPSVPETPVKRRGRPKKTDPVPA